MSEIPTKTEEPVTKVVTKPQFLSRKIVKIALIVVIIITALYFGKKILKF